MQLDLQTIAEALGQPCTAEAADVLISRVVSDSREASCGTLFACIAGERVDGHDYAAQACGAGASAILAEHPLDGLAERFPNVAVFCVDDTIKALGRIARVWRDRFRGTVIGLTGTAGKTTTKEWLAAVLGVHAKVAKTEGNHNNQLGLPLSMLSADGDEKYWIFECGVSHAQDMDELGSILHPDAAIVLNVGEGHTEGLGDKGVAWYKTRLFKYLAPNGLAAASADYADLVRCAKDVCPKVKFFSAAKEPFASAEDIVSSVQHKEENLYTAAVTCEGKTVQQDVHLPLTGPAAAENLACLAAVCSMLHVDLADIEKGLAEVSVPGHRFRRIEAGSCRIIDDCYNANPLSMSRMLAAAHEEAMQKTDGRLLLVLGCMGELGSLEAEAHRRLGRQIKELAPMGVFWKGGCADKVLEGLGSGIPFAVFSGDEELCTAAGKLMQDLGTTPSRAHCTLLCKGSRSNHLETAVLALEKLFGAESD